MKRVKILLDGQPFLSQTFSQNSPLSEVRSLIKEMNENILFTESFEDCEFPIPLKEEENIQLQDVLFNDVFVKLTNSAEKVKHEKFKFYLNDQPFLTKSLPLTNTLQEIRENIEEIKFNHYFLFDGFPLSHKDEETFDLMQLSEDFKIYMVENKQIKTIPLSTPPNKMRSSVDIVSSNTLTRDTKQHSIYSTPNSSPASRSSQFKSENNFSGLINSLLPLSTLLPSIKGFQTYLYPTFDLNPIEETQAKTLIFLGQTGSGKTTLINGLINYIIGIKRSDPIRFLLIHEDTNKSQSQSQTSEVKVFRVKGHNGHSPLKIIDTPGFADTREEFDYKIFDMIKKVFETQIDVLHTICFVAPSSLVRLTDQQKYILSKFFEIFAEDMLVNIVFLFTFCDYGEPKIIDGLTDQKDSYLWNIINSINSPWYYKFNNSSLFECFDQMDSHRKTYWDLGMKSYKDFMMDKVIQNKAVSIIHTKKVLTNRQKLEDILKVLSPELDLTFTLKENIRETIENLKSNASEISANKDFKIFSKCQKPVRKALEPGIHTTTCLDCNRTCHLNCEQALDQDKHKCRVMNNGSCRVCPKKCRWNNHCNVPYEIQFQEVNIEVRADDLFKKYSNAKSNKERLEQVIFVLTNQLREGTLRCIQLQNEVIDCVNVLNSISLKKNVGESHIEYLNLMIQSEELDKKKGYQNRIKRLSDVRRQYSILKNIIERNKNIDLNSLFEKARLFIKKPEFATPEEKKIIQNMFEEFDSLFNKI